MKIFYHCFGGAHSSVTAANIHLNRLPKDRVPGFKELFNQNPFFDQREVNDTGKVVHMGQDGMGNDIYVVGRQSRPQLLYFITEKISEVFSINKDSYTLVNMSTYVNYLMRIGGFISRRLGLIKLGRPIVTWGTQRNYQAMVAEVQKVIGDIKQTEAKN